jgi:hypothetical protein
MVYLDEVVLNVWWTKPDKGHLLDVGAFLVAKKDRVGRPVGAGLVGARRLGGAPGGGCAREWGGSTDMNSWRMTVLGFLSKELTVDLVFRRKSR